MSAEIGIQSVESLIGQLEARGPGQVDGLLSQIAEAMGAMLGVRPGEVALLQITPNRSSLVFVLPLNLRKAGAVPLKVDGGLPLSVQTVLERRPEVINDFASRPHARMFEAVPLGIGPSAPIQKIISCPVFHGQLVIGVVQVSRKGMSAAAAGPDFTASDLNRLQQLNGFAGRIIAAGAVVPPTKELSDAELRQIASNKRRRSTRVTIHIPIEIIHQGSGNRIIVEETQTLTVSAYGAGIILKNAPQIGQTVVLINKQSREEMLCRVLNTRPIPKTTNHEAGITFNQPSPLFWHINFPPEDWDPAVRKNVWTPQKSSK